MTTIAWAEEADIPCEPGAELCGGCDAEDCYFCNRFEIELDASGNGGFSRRCPACLRAERRAALRARLARKADAE